MDIHVINPKQLKSDPAEMGAFGPDGRLLVHPAEYWAQFNQAEISMFCVRHGIYCVPTVELVDWLKQEIGGEPTIEIGAGNGVLAEALGIPATDNKMQLWPEIVAVYQGTNQALVKYGPQVLQYTAEEAIQTFKPRCVIAAWVTHRYDTRAHWRGGNAYGVLEEAIVRRAKYCFIGNRSVHQNKPILALPHRELRFPWLVSRAIKPHENFIAVWQAPKERK